jgi:Xaa-Pro dipeptidase
LKKKMRKIVPKTEIEQRLHNLRRRLEKGGIDGALFIYPIDVYYFTGSRQNAALWVPAEGKPTLFVRKSFSRALKDSLIEDVRPFPSSKELPAFFGEKAARIGLTFDVLPVQQYQFYSNLLTGKEFVDISTINRQLRSVKSAWEIEQMRTSAKILCGAFARVPDILRRGMRELDLAAEFEYLLRKAGSDGHLRIRAFHQEIVGLAVAGDNAAVPGCFDGPVTGKGLSSATPYGPSADLIREGEPVIIDYGLIHNGYIVDMTRVFVFGQLDPELERAFALSLEIQKWLVENIKPGKVCQELFAGAEAIAASAGLKDKFMGSPGEQAKFVGHGVGLELDEFPVLARKFKSPVETGQTIAIEPKFVFPYKGVVGIENTYAVNDSGCDRLTLLSDSLVYL